ncbi:MAG: hypothetical protein AAFX06_21615 [Planctomycetota bacterium]
MKRILLAAAMLAGCAFGCSSTASANHPSAYPFFPFGFYQPYGARFGTSLQTPPYFATNPPVYYGARHARPYGMSPFAAPPMVSAPEGYRGRLRTDFFTPPQPAAVHAPTCSHCATPAESRPVGVVRTNPFMTESQVAKN